jgi:hypothetical protein
MFTEFLYGIFQFNYDTKPIDIVKYRHLATKAQYNYNMYKKTNNEIHKNSALKYIRELETHLTIYDARLIYGIDVVNMKYELLPQVNQ